MYARTWSNDKQYVETQIELNVKGKLAFVWAYHKIIFNLEVSVVLYCNFYNGKNNQTSFRLQYIHISYQVHVLLMRIF